MHLHHDHAGLDAQLPEARILGQRRELQYAAIITGDAAYVADLNVGAQVPRSYWVDLPETMVELRGIAADSHGMMLPMHDRSVHERYPQGLG
jgi:glyoxylase-like metal-dependent hydrolase (beta-lactamase superfamily II)